MRAIIAGGGNVGRHLAADLVERGHEVSLIEQEPGPAAKAERSAKGVAVIMGDACELWVLEKAKIQTADVVVAATGDDEDNLVISLLAKQEFSVPRVLARVNHPKNEWLFTEQWGVDAAVSPPHILTSLVELTLPENSANIGHPLYEMRLPPDATIVAILREGHVVIPQPETVLAEGDEIIVLTAPQAEAALRQAVVGQAEPL